MPTQRINLDVSFITFHDDDMPGTNITDKNSKTFVVTTGGFPQEVLLVTRASSAKFSKITMVFEGAKDIVLEKCRVNETAYEVIAERSLAVGEGREGKQRQTEVLDLDPEGAGKDIRMLRLRIVSGYKDFVAIYSVDAIGEESEQQMVVLESRPEVNL